jgi:hypothetical protein
MAVAINVVNCVADGFLRLAGGNMTNEGRLEFFRNGTWGPFCFESELMNMTFPNFTKSICGHLGYR